MIVTGPFGERFSCHAYCPGRRRDRNNRYHSPAYPEVVMRRGVISVNPPPLVHIDGLPVVDHCRSLTGISKATIALQTEDTTLSVRQVAEGFGSINAHTIHMLIEHAGRA